MRLSMGFGEGVYSRNLAKFPTEEQPGLCHMKGKDAKKSVISPDLETTLHPIGSEA